MRCPAGFYCEGGSDEPKLCKKGHYCEGGEQKSCSSYLEAGTVEITLKGASSRPFYSSVCHQYASGAFKTIDVFNFNDKLFSKDEWPQWRDKACKENKPPVSECKKNEFRDKGKCEACLPGYICSGKYAVAT